MNLNEAIAILTTMRTPNFTAHTEDILAARQLGIEALKRLRDFRIVWSKAMLSLLPGETKK